MARLIDHHIELPMNGTIGCELVLSCKLADISATLDSLRDSLERIRDAHGLLKADVVTRGSDIIIHFHQMYVRDIRRALGLLPQTHANDSSCNTEEAVKIMAAKAEKLMHDVEHGLEDVGVIDAIAA